MKTENIKNVLLMTSGEPGRGPCSTKEKRFPLGLGFLISVLRKAGHNVFFIDNYLKPSTALEDGFLHENNIDYVGIYANTICFRDTERMIAVCADLRKQALWQGKIMVGGPHTSVQPESISKEVDFIVQGEGEISILDIVEGRETNRFVQGKPVENLDSLPMPAYDCFQDDLYWTRVEPLPDDPIYTMNTSRGCPFHCRFCSVKGIWGKTFRAFSAERIVADIEKLIADYGVKGIYFREDHFTFHKKRTRDFCNLLIAKNIKIKWFAESRVDVLDEDLLALMRKSGCEWLYLGCESGTQKMLDYYIKGVTLKQIEDAVALCQKYDIKTYTSWIVGGPGETDEDIQKTLDFIDKLKPTQAGKNVFMGLPGSDFYDELENSNQFFHKDDIGIIFLDNYNRLVERFYGNPDYFKVPFKKINDYL